MYMSLVNARQEAERTTRMYVDEAMDKYDIPEWFDYNGISAINNAENELVYALMYYSKESNEVQEAEESLVDVIESYAKEMQDEK